MMGALGPLIALGTGAVLAMVLAPKAPAWLTRGVAAAGMAVAAALAALRLGLPPGPSVAILTDDGLARFGILVSSLTGLAALVWLRPAPPAREGPALMSLAALGGALLSGATHAAPFFIGLELVTLALIALFVLPLTRTALEAGYKLLIMGGAGAASLLMGLAFFYAASGTLDLAGWAPLPQLRGDPLMAIGTGFLLAGLAFKFALVPFHMWAPDGFEGAPAAAAAFAGAASKAVVAIALVRLADVGLPEPVWSGGLMLLGAASILLGNFLALRQDSITRMLGYSSVSHSGYLAVLIASGLAAPEAVPYYLMAYAPALLAVLCVSARLGPDPQIQDLRGLGWARPLSGTALTLGLISLAGLPAVAGFVAKIYLFVAILAAADWLSVGAVLIGSALGFYYYLRFVVMIWRRLPPGTETPHYPVQEARAAPVPNLPLAETAVLVAACALLLAAGLYPAPFTDLLAGLGP
ncbi:MAG: NADH-quinone oxidoreductase subunit N [Alkalilacustris sp.]